MECQKVKYKVECNKYWAKSMKYSSCTSSKPPKILPAGGYRLNKREQNVNVLMKRVILRSVRLIGSTEKKNEQTAVKIGQS